MPLGAVGTVRVKPPSTAVALWNLLIKSMSEIWLEWRDLRSEDGAGNGDEGSVDLRFSIRCGDDGSRGQKGDLGAHGDVAVAVCRGKLGESLRVSR